MTKAVSNADGLPGDGPLTMAAMLLASHGWHRARSTKMFVIVDLAFIPTFIRLRQHYRNITTQLRQVYDLPWMSGLSSPLDEGMTSVLQVSSSSLSPQLQLWRGSKFTWKKGTTPFDGDGQAGTAVLSSKSFLPGAPLP
jgi:hypothetical protein